ncbi:kelch repeat-containing protein [Arsenicitalea aurantiaca]|uniref:Kelch repeat-containing protein n=1 Tax=Arsenicitalea aurantiaca TaxID=1783274 RepID=A0A433XAH9_9HYPH|nr:kelch repeat-containing protein [Arsenicitalea aurantiaca]RUT31062.1 kelch repeat-containing protein [Arsenicitalea aurantiaca]
MRLLASLATASAFAFAPPAPLAHEVGWAAGGSAPAERSEVAVAELDGKAYVVGDYNGATEILIYDLGTETWSTGAPFPYPVHHTAAIGHAGEILVFGGYVNGWKASDRLWIYSPATNSWREADRMPTARAAGGIGMLEGRIHLVGGSTSSAINIADHDAFDLATGRWESLAPIPTPRDHLAVGVIGDRLVATGGRVDGDPARNLDTTQIYDPKTDSWSEGAPMPTARSGMASAVLGTELFTFGGETRVVTFPETEAYDLPSDGWSRHAPLPTPRHGFGAVTHESRIVTLTGSPVAGGGRSDIVETFTPPAR